MLNSRNHYWAAENATHLTDPKWISLVAALEWIIFLKVHSCDTKSFPSLSITYWITLFVQPQARNSRFHSFVPFHESLRYLLTRWNLSHKRLRNRIVGNARGYRSWVQQWIKHAPRALSGRCCLNLYWILYPEGWANISSHCRVGWLSFGTSLSYADRRLDTHRHTTRRTLARQILMGERCEMLSEKWVKRN